MSDTEQSGVRRLEDVLLQDGMDILCSIEDDVNADIRLESSLRARCPMDHDLVNEYAVAVDYQPADGDVIETAAFRNFLDHFEAEPASQEAITTFLHRILHAHFDLAWLRVRLEGQHDGVGVTATKERGER